MNRRSILCPSAIAAFALVGNKVARNAGAARSAPSDMRCRVVHTDGGRRKILSPAAYHVLRLGGTEPPFTSPLLHEKRVGIFHCIGCALPLYSSATKYDSGSGWPSFWNHLPYAVGTRKDASFAMVRTEVHCSKCGGHLGHVFPDGPPPTGLRYCMNGVALFFTAEVS